jgi:hypothetical protein
VQNFIEKEHRILPGGGKGRLDEYGSAGDDERQPIDGEIFYGNALYLKRGMGESAKRKRKYSPIPTSPFLRFKSHRFSVSIK